MSLIRPQELVDCRFYLNESCNKGKQCPFRHCAKARDTEKLCRYWSSNPHCEKVGCPYRHPVLATGPAHTAPPTPEKSKSKKDKSGAASGGGSSGGGKQKKDKSESVGNDSKSAPASNSSGLPTSGQLAVFWDIENCPVFSGRSAAETVKRIRAVVNPTGKLREVAFRALCNTAVLSSDVQTSLAHSTVEIVHVPNTGKAGATDRAILLALDRFERQTKPPATVVLISGDIDFVGKLSDLRNQAGYTVVVIHSANAKQELKSAVSHVISWKSVGAFDANASAGKSQKDKKSTESAGGGGGKSGKSGAAAAGAASATAAAAAEQKRKVRQKKGGAGSGDAKAAPAKTKKLPKGGSGDGGDEAGKPKKAKVLCPKNHPLKRFKAGHQPANYGKIRSVYCSACKKDIRDSDPFFHCMPCKQFDLCKTCHNKAKAAASTGASAAADSKSKPKPKPKPSAQQKSKKRAPTEAETQKDESDDVVWECPECDSQFGKVSSLVQHMMATNHRWTCKCGSQFASPQALAQHQRDTGHVSDATGDSASEAGGDDDGDDDDDDDDDDEDGFENGDDDDLIPDPNYILERNRDFYCPHPACSKSKWASWSDRYDHLRETGHAYRCSECKQFFDSGNKLAAHEADSGHFHTGERDDFDYYLRRQYFKQAQVSYPLARLHGRMCRFCGAGNPPAWRSWPVCFLCETINVPDPQPKPKPVASASAAAASPSQLAVGAGVAAAAGMAGMMAAMRAQQQRQQMLQQSALLQQQQRLAEERQAQRAAITAAMAASAAAAVAAVIAPSSWSCKACTFANSPALQACEICATPKQ